MVRAFAMVMAAALLTGCTAPAPTVDPFFGRPTVPPPTPGAPLTSPPPGGYYQEPPYSSSSYPAAPRSAAPPTPASAAPGPGGMLFQPSWGAPRPQTVAGGAGAVRYYESGAPTAPPASQNRPMQASYTEGRPANATPMNATPARAYSTPPQPSALSGPGQPVRVLESPRAEQDSDARPVAVPVPSSTEPRRFVPSGQPVDIMDLEESAEEAETAPKESSLKFRPASQVR